MISAELHDENRVSTIEFVRDLGRDDAVDLLAGACATAGATLISSSLRAVHDRAPGSCSRVYDVNLDVAGDERGVLLVVHATSGKVPGPSIALERGDHTVHVWRFPNDPYLPGLPSMVSRARIRELLDELGVAAGEVILRTRSYRPSRRAVVEVQIDGLAARGRVLFLKALAGKRAERVAGIHRQLDEILPVPRVAGVADELGIVALEALGGLTLRQELAGGSSLPPAQAVVDLSRILASSGLQSGADPARFADPRRHVPTLARHLPDLADRIAEVASESIAFAREPVPVHGDFHDAQILVDDGRIVGLLDVDGAGTGSIAHDAANLLVHVQSAGARKLHRLSVQFVDELTASYRAIVGPDSLRRATAGAWLSLATGPLRTRDPGWLDEARGRIERAIEALESE